jgi:hypothetical protein
VRGVEEKKKGTRSEKVPSLTPNLKAIKCGVGNSERMR